jgi:hypothetical protein
VKQVTNEELEIYDDQEKLTFGIRLSKEYGDKIETYMFNEYFGYGMNMSINDATKLRDKLDELIKFLSK